MSYKRVVDESASGLASARRPMSAWLGLVASLLTVASVRAQNAKGSVSTLDSPPPAAAESSTRSKNEATPLPSASPSAPPAVEVPEHPPALESKLGRPWNRGVSARQVMLAEGFFHEGNALLRESLFRPAIEKYQSALAEWDHPGIHYNLVLALLNLDTPLEVHKHLRAILRWGDSALDADRMDFTKTFLRLVEKQLTLLELDCDLPGAEVTLDGQWLFQGPGRHRQFVLPGPHAFLASKDGYVPTERSAVLVAGKSVSIHLPLYTSEVHNERSRRWPGWQPAFLSGTIAGAAVLATGVVLSAVAADRFRTFDNRVKGECPGAQGCTNRTDLDSIREDGEHLQRGALVSCAVGGAVIAGGLTLLYLNRAMPERLEQGEPRASGTWVPLLSPHSLGFRGAFSF